MPPNVSFLFYTAKKINRVVQNTLLVLHILGQPLTLHAATFMACVLEGSGQNHYIQTGPTKPQNRWWSLPPPLPRPQKMVSLLQLATPLSKSKNENLRFKPHFSCLSTNADSCYTVVDYFSINLNFKANNFVGNVHEIGGVFNNPPTPDNSRWVLFQQTCYNQFPY